MSSTTNNLDEMHQNIKSLEIGLGDMKMALNEAHFENCDIQKELGAANGKVGDLHEEVDSLKTHIKNLFQARRHKNFT